MVEKNQKNDSEPKNEPKYEEQVQKLENIIRKLEEGELELEESISLYEEGMRLLKLCEEQLHRAEQKIEKLIKDETGVKRIPFNPEDKQ